MPGEGRTGSLVYRRDIDGLRSVAVMGVVFFHAFPDCLPGGFVGVDVFFVISGFLISGLILRDVRQGQFSVTSFYSRRILRIFPALTVVLATCLAFGSYVLFPDEYRQLAKHAIGGAASVSNLVLLRETGYFDAAAQSKPLLHLWSLGIEEQFYIIWPLFLLLICKCTKRIMAPIWAVAIISFALNVLFIAKSQSATFYLPATRAWELMVGAALAGLPPRNPALRRKGQFLIDSMAAIGLMLITLSLFFLDDKTPFPGWPALLPTSGAALVIWAGPSAWLNRTMLSSRPAVTVGLISYPLYLWHWPVLVYMKLITDSDFTVSANEFRFSKSVALLAIIALAWATWRFVETPIRLRKAPAR